MLVLFFSAWIASQTKQRRYYTYSPVSLEARNIHNATGCVRLVKLQVYNSLIAFVALHHFTWAMYIIVMVAKC